MCSARRGARAAAHTSSVVLSPTARNSHARSEALPSQGRKVWSTASRRTSPAVGNQRQYCSEAKKPMNSTPASMVGTDHRPSRNRFDATSKRPPRSRAACTPIAIAMP
jgi:hypothetical protein